MNHLDLKGWLSASITPGWVRWVNNVFVMDLVGKECHDEEEEPVCVFTTWAAMEGMVNSWRARDLMDVSASRSMRR